MFIPLPFYSPMDALPGLELNSLIEYLFKFFLCSIRLSAFFISSPFFGSRVIPLNVKIIFSLVISFFYFGYLSDIQISEQILDNLSYCSNCRSFDWIIIRFNTNNMVCGSKFGWRENSSYYWVRFFPNG